MRLLTLLIIFFYLCFPLQITYAFTDGSPSNLFLLLMNNSSKTLNYMGVRNANPGNIFSIMPTEIPPLGVAMITGTLSTPYFDLIGNLLFKDSTPNGNIFSIIDHRLFYAGEPTFSMRNDRFISFVTSKTFNKMGDPRALSYTAATVVIEDNVDTLSSSK